MSKTRVEIVEENLDAYLADADPAALRLAPDEPLRAGSGLSARKAVEVFEDMLLSRALDVTARELKKTNRSYYTISSAGHELNAVLGAVLAAMAAIRWWRPHPDRMASRILGMGDVMSLIEKAEATLSKKDAAKVAGKVKKGNFTLEDFRDQLRQIKKMGSMSDLLGMIPGAGKLMKNLPDVIPDKELSRVEAMIGSMTVQERRNHTIINGSRRKRIARGSGTTVQDVNRLLKNFAQGRKMMKAMAGAKGKKYKLRNMLPF